MQFAYFQRNIYRAFNFIRIEKHCIFVCNTLYKSAL